MEDGVRNSADQVKTAEIKAVHHVPGNDALDQVEVIRIVALSEKHRDRTRLQTSLGWRRFNFTFGSGGVWAPDVSPAYGATWCNSFARRLWQSKKM